MVINIKYVECRYFRCPFSWQSIIFTDGEFRFEQNPSVTNKYLLMPKISTRAALLFRDFDGNTNALWQGNPISVQRDFNSLNRGTVYEQVELKIFNNRLITATARVIPSRNNTCINDPACFFRFFILPLQFNFKSINDYSMI